MLGDFKTNTKVTDIKERGEVEAVHIVRTILRKDDEFYGTYLYINFLHRSASLLCTRAGLAAAVSIVLISVTLAIT